MKFNNIVNLPNSRKRDISTSYMNKNDMQDIINKVNEVKYINNMLEIILYSSS